MQHSSTLGQQWDHDDSWKKFPSNKEPRIITSTSTATSHAMMSEMNTEYVTSFITETIQINRVVSEIDCLTDPCAGCATVQVMGEDITNNLIAVEAITEVLEKGTYIWGNGNCTASNAVHLTDYYVVTSNSEKRFLFLTAPREIASAGEIYQGVIQFQIAWHKSASLMVLQSACNATQTSLRRLI
eukprot:CFRG5360T1